ncbi:hypothetical protein MPTK1_1g16140 [Marchantia polymorpha subsp. ruderalis]|nr:hypothetical protein MARPO_0033s0046 [Marchantia polymorpha]BBM98774.1 hypothetical protein Mp_1g16140 [Marchantia polymorpha subsp. ruderalis]|eukprot:PTQ41629.1 hypothetical protein MARPO_0033s0046 [Marchantia polymorpha]
MRKGGTSSAPTTPKGGNGRGGNAQPTQLAEEHHIVATTFVQADVNNFRELVQKLTGGPPSPLPTTPTSELSNGKEATSTPSRREPIPGRPEPERIMSVKPVGGPGPQRTSTAKLFERRQNAKKLEVKQLMGPHILKRTISPALSPVSPLTNDVFSEQSSGATSPLGYMGYSPVPRPSFDLEQPPTATSPSFDLNSGIIQLELERPRNSEPRLLPLFPLHSPRSLSS